MENEARLAKEVMKLLTENLMKAGLMFKDEGAARRANRKILFGTKFVDCLKCKAFICIQFNETTKYSFFLDVARGKFDARAKDVDLNARVGRVFTKPNKDLFISPRLQSNQNNHS
jgi:hypothetical protein